MRSLLGSIVIAMTLFFLLLEGFCEGASRLRSKTDMKASISLHNTVSFANTSVWDQYLQIYGSRLEKMIANEKTLESMINNPIQSLDTSIASSQVICATYENGHRLAMKLRLGGFYTSVDSIWRPFIVDQGQNRMCFATYSSTTLPPSIQSLISFSFPVPAPLKIETSIYDFIHNTTATVEFPKLTVSYLMNMTSTSVNEVMSSLISTTVTNLANYDSHVLNNFFWTSPTINSDFITKDIDGEDKMKSIRWIQLTSDLMHMNLSTDPCGFKSMTIENHIDRIILSLDGIKALEQSLQSKCLAYAVASLSSQPAVWHISFSNLPQLFNFRARSIIETAVIGSASYFTPYTKSGLQGDGQVGSIADTGVDVQSCYFYDPSGTIQFSTVFNPITNLNARKIVQYTYYPGAGDTSDEVGGHGTHVSGSMVGNKLGADITQDGMYDGVAPNAVLAFMDLGTPGSGLAIPPVSNLYGPGMSAGAAVHSNSWGTYHSAANYYVGADIDQFLYSNMGMTIFFAAGNFGGDGYNSVSLEAQAKNVVSVGSSESTFNSNNINYASFFSSHGPSFDGRIKPEVLAPGDSIMSAMSNGGNGQSCNTISMMGTSMSSPVAGGTALLIRQYFNGVNSNIWASMCNTQYSYCKNFSPSGVLVKAILIHSGSPMTLFDGQAGGKGDAVLGNPPDMIQGYGRVKLLNVLPLSGYTDFDLFVDDLNVIDQMSAVSYYVTISDNTVPLKVTLSWYDPAGVYGTTSSVLLNNLDLTITDPNGNNYYGNGGSSPDTLNNNEQVFISQPLVGSYKVVVSANSLPATGSQPYSIVITSGGSVGQCSCS